MDGPVTVLEDVSPQAARPVTPSPSKAATESNFRVLFIVAFSFPKALGYQWAIYTQILLLDLCQSRIYAKSKVSRIIYIYM